MRSSRPTAAASSSSSTPTSLLPDFSAVHPLVYAAAGIAVGIAGTALLLRAPPSASASTSSSASTSASTSAATTSSPSHTTNRAAPAGQPQHLGIDYPSPRPAVKEPPAVILLGPPPAANPSATHPSLSSPSGGRPPPHTHSEISSSSISSSSSSSNTLTPLAQPSPRMPDGVASPDRTGYGSAPSPTLSELCRFEQTLFSQTEASVSNSVDTIHRARMGSEDNIGEDPSAGAASKDSAYGDGAYGGSSHATRDMTQNVQQQHASSTPLTSAAATGGAGGAGGAGGGRSISSSRSPRRAGGHDDMDDMMYDLQNEGALRTATLTTLNHGLSGSEDPRSMLSGEHLSDALSACTGKPADASDMCDLAQAQQEVRHLRGVLRRMVLPEEGADPSAVRLRVIAVNDVYELDNLPRLANLVKSCSVGYPPSNVLVTLAGDFLAPSVLSMLDGGKGMIETLNAVPVTHMCFGNHENDVPLQQLVSRCGEYEGKWINSNMPGFNKHYPLPTDDVVTVVSADGLHTRKVALLGVLLHDPNIHRAGAFGGSVPTMEPCNDAVLRRAADLVANHGVDIVLPMTHQDVADDQRLAKQAPPYIPVIIGGHDHDLVVSMSEHEEGASVVKAGSDAFQAVIIDIEWNDPPCVSDEADIELHAPPTMRVTLESCGQFPKDVRVEKIAYNALYPIRELRRSTFFSARGRTWDVNGMPECILSSVKVRTEQVTMGTLICSALRDSLEGAEVCLFVSGGIRGAREYPDEFSYFDLKGEIGFETYMVILPMTGKDLAEAIRESRSFLPTPHGGFLQVDDLCRVKGCSPSDCAILTEVAGAPLDLERVYSVATDHVLLTGMNKNETFIRLGNEYPVIKANKDACPLAKPILVSYFCRDLIHRLGGVGEFDLDNDGEVTREEVQEVLQRKIDVDLKAKGLNWGVQDDLTRDSSAVRVPSTLVDAVLRTALNEVGVKNGAEGKDP